MTTRSSTRCAAAWSSSTSAGSCATTPEAFTASVADHLPPIPRGPTPPMRASFVLSEVLTGLRRNLTMTIAMILTTAVSLALLGEGLLVVRMIDKTQALYQDKLEVSIYLNNDVSAKDK